jgi:hypothetical protein
MPQSIEYEKQMNEIVYVNLPGPSEADPGMSGGDLLHGFLAELYRAPSVEIRAYIGNLCIKWNVRYREQKG